MRHVSRGALVFLPLCSYICVFAVFATAGIQNPSRSWVRLNFLVDGCEKTAHNLHDLSLKKCRKPASKRTLDYCHKSLIKSRNSFLLVVTVPLNTVPVIWSKMLLWNNKSNSLPAFLMCSSNKFSFSCMQVSALSIVSGNTLYFRRMLSMSVQGSAYTRILMSPM